MRFYATALTLCVLGGLSAPAAAQERQWSLDAADQDAFLVFGVPETDDVGVSFWCRIGSNRIKIFVPDASPRLPAGGDAEFTLVVGAAIFPLKGQATANDMTGATSVESELEAVDKAILALSETDRFSIQVAGHVATYPMAEADFKSLLRLCRSR